jgi:hypothetical protein
MASGETDLRALLEADRQIVLDILDHAYKLIVDVGAHYYWTHHALEICGKLVNIGNNLTRLLDLSGVHWSEGSRAFNHPEPLKLWNTSIGLFRALGPEKAKFVEQLAKRRRQRIMGQAAVDEADTTDPAVAAADRERFKEEYAKLIAQYSALLERIREVPNGLIPSGDESLELLNGKQDAIGPGSVVATGDTASPAAPPPPELGGDAGEP